MNPPVDAVALLPEFFLCSTLVLVLVADLWVPDDKRSWLTGLSALGTTATLVASLALFASERHGGVAGEAFVVDSYSLFAKIVLVASTLVVIGLGVKQSWKGEYLTLILGALLGAMALVSARDLVTFVVAFELLALPGYLLTAWQKRAANSAEASIKYFLLGAVATALMLYGASLVFGVTGATAFSEIASGAQAKTGDPILLLGVVFLLAGIAFKLAAAPFHFWTPDAYQGAPVPIAAFLSVVSKIAGLLALLAVVLLALPSEEEVWVPLLATLAIVSMVVGNVAALRQHDVVRMLAYSSVAQSGYALVPIALAHRLSSEGNLAVESLLTFVALFAVSNLAVFAAVVASGPDTSYVALEGAMKRRPVVAAAMVVGLMSLAGIPPFAGWFAKLVVFAAAIEPGDAMGVILAITVAVGTAIGLFVYAVVVARMWKPGLTDAFPTTRNVLTVVVVLVGATVVLGVVPGVVTGPVGAVSL